MTLETRNEQLPLATRAAPVSSIDEKTRTVTVVFSTGAAVRRARYKGWDERIPYDEVLVVNTDAVNLTRLNAGAAVVDSHDIYSTRSQVAVVDKAWIDGGQGLADVRFPSAGLDESADRMFGLVKEGIVRNISVGYTQDQIRVVEPQAKGEIEQRIVERWTPHEISFVTVPADVGAQVRSEDQRDGARTFPAVVHYQRKDIGMEAANETPAAPPVATETRAAPIDAAEILRNERQRVADLLGVAQRHDLPAEMSSRAIADNLSLDAFRAQTLDYLEEQTRKHGMPASAGFTVTVTNPGESPDALREAMVDGIVMRALGYAPEASAKGVPKIANEARSREFAGMSLLEMAAGTVGIRNAHRMQNVRLYDEFVQRTMLGTSDFPLLLSAAANKFLLAQYQYQTPAYRAFSVQKTFNDFKAHNFLRIGDFPNLEQLSETGEFRNGAISENREQVYALTYGKIVSLSRQMFVNDDLSAFSDLASLAGKRVADFENSVAWGVVLSNTKAGPTMSDTGGLWNSTAVTTAGGHANLAGTGTAVTVAAVTAGRLAMRQQKSLDGIPLNVNPSIIVAGPAKQTDIEQLLSTQLLATQISNINPYNGGGMTRLSPQIDAYITDNAWYLFADPAAAPTFVHGYVSGYVGPRFTVDQPFRYDGLALKVAEDFGFGAIDWRGAYRNPGA